MLKITFFISVFLLLFNINNSYAQNSNESKMNTTSYTDKQIIIELQLTPGMPNSDSYQLKVYGNGEYSFKNSLGKKKYTSANNKGTISDKEIEYIFKTAEEINFFEEINKNMLRPQKQVRDGQSRVISIWHNGYLRRASFSSGNYMNKETKALADYILSLVRN